MAEESTTTVEAPPARLKTIYQNDIRPKLQEEFGYESVMQHPRVTKVTLSMGVGEAKSNSKALDQALEQLAVIAGQKPAMTRAR
ncbi:MAG: 50S ribosomal protein L5, partial [Miltoncostaeaceae bacterium]